LADLFYQTGPHWVLLHVEPFLRVTVGAPQAMMKSQRLPDPMLVIVRFTESALPKCDPLLDGEIQIARRGEQMQMVRHQNVIPDQPYVSSTEGIHEQAVRLFASQPRTSVLCANGDEHNRRLLNIHANALRRFAAHGPVLGWKFIHITVSEPGPGSAGASPYRRTVV
jgi:hypothetical protein